MAFSVSYVYDIVDRYSAKMAKISAMTKKFQATTDKAGKSIKKLGDKTKEFGKDIIALSAVAATAVVFPVKGAIEYEDKLTDVYKVYNKISDAGKKMVRQEIENVAKVTGIRAGLIAELAAQAVVGGVQQEHMPKFLMLAGKVKVAFDTTEKEASKLITDFKTNAKVTMDMLEGNLDLINQLSQEIPKTTGKDILLISGDVSALTEGKINTEALLAYSAVARESLKTADIAVTAMRNLFNELPKKLPDVWTEIKADPKRGLLGFIEKLSKMKPIERDKIIGAFGLEVQPLLAGYVSNIKDLKKALDISGDRSRYAGSMTDEFNAKMAATRGIISKVLVVLDIINSSLGESLLPIIKELGAELLPYLQKVEEWVKTHQNIAKWALIVSAAIAVIAPILIGLGAVIGIAGSAATALGITLGALAAAIGWVSLAVVAVIAVVAGVIYAYKNWGKITEWLKAKWSQFKTFMSAIWEDMKVAALNFWEALKEMVGPVFDFLGKVVKGYFGIYKWVFDKILEAFMSFLEFFGVDTEKLKEVFTAAVKSMLAVFTETFDKIKGIYDKVRGWFSREIVARVRVDEEAAKEVSESRDASDKRRAKANERRNSAIQTQKHSVEVNGSLDVSTDKGTKFRGGRLQTNRPGKLGFNMG